MKGILFKPDMIKAIVDLRKTVTRRVINPQPEPSDTHDWYWKPGGMLCSDGYFRERAPYHARYQVGETVYIKEAWRTEKHLDKFSPSYIGGAGYAPIFYRADEPTCTILVLGRWRSPLHLPVWAARYFIKITDVRAERLQEITEEDATAEGLKYHIDDFQPGCSYMITGREKFNRLWDSLNKDYPWEANPWVFRYEFCQQAK